MSFICYTTTRAREYFQVRNVPEHFGMINTIFYKLNSLSAMMCRKGVESLSVNLTINNTSYSFTGEKVTPEFTEIIEKVFDSASADSRPESGKQPAEILTITMDYALHDMDDFFLEEAEPYSTLNLFNDEEYYQELRDDIFYYTFIEDTGYDCAGNIYAYGTFNGKEYHGCPEFKDLDAMPECKSWYAPCTAMIYDMEDDVREFISKEKLSKLKECCNKLMKYSCYDLLRSDDTEFQFQLNNLSLNGTKQVEEFIPIAQEFCRMTDQVFDVEFLELGVNEPVIYNMLVNGTDASFSVKKLF